MNARTAFASRALAGSTPRSAVHTTCAQDTHAHKARRVLEGTLFVARRAPLGASATIAVEVMDILWKYGPPGLAGLVLRREFIEVK